jgi:hypothetical protein
MSNRNYANGKALYAMHVKPVLLDCNFIVDSTNGNGLGIRNLKGPMIQNAFMHTTSTPGPGNSNPASPNVVVTNPNPASGTIVIQFQDNFNRSFSGFNSNVSPLSGSPLLVASAGLTVGVAYVIVSVGTTTTAQWNALGLPLGVTPAIGASFIAAATSTPGTGAVEITAAAGSTIMSIETVGDPNASIAPNPSVSQGFGGQFILQCRNISGAIAAPADGTVISLGFYLSDSSILIQGE